MGILNTGPKAGWANRTFLADHREHIGEGGGVWSPEVGMMDRAAVMLVPKGAWYVAPVTS